MWCLAGWDGNEVELMILQRFMCFLRRLRSSAAYR
jgi:hypothetical protein